MPRAGRRPEPERARVDRAIERHVGEVVAVGVAVGILDEHPAHDALGAGRIVDVDHEATLVRAGARRNELHGLRARRVVGRGREQRAPVEIEIDGAHQELERGHVRSRDAARRVLPRTAFCERLVPDPARSIAGDDLAVRRVVVHPDLARLLDHDAAARAHGPVVHTSASGLREPRLHGASRAVVGVRSVGDLARARTILRGRDARVRRRPREPSGEHDAGNGEQQVASFHRDLSTLDR